MAIGISGPGILRGYIGKEQKKIQEYIKNQLQQDQIADQLSLKEFVDPFTGSKGKQSVNKKRPLGGLPRKGMQLTDPFVAP